MGELGFTRRYEYWSDRQVKIVSSSNNINLSNGWRMDGFTIPFLGSQAQFTKDPRPDQHHAVATRIEEAIGHSAVEDFVTPPSATYVKGCSDVTFAPYTRWGSSENRKKEEKRKGVIIHSRFKSSTGCCVELCLFGSLDNCTGYLSNPQPEAPRWSSSSTWAIEEFVANHGDKPAPIYDDDESIAVEILRVFNNEGMTEKYVSRRFKSADWFAYVYHDVELDKSRWNLKPGKDLPEPVDRIVIGAPLWVRTQSC